MLLPHRIAFLGGGHPIPDGRMLAALLRVWQGPQPCWVTPCDAVVHDPRIVLWLLAGARGAAVAGSVPGPALGLFLPPGAPVPVLTWDDAAIGRLGGRHLAERCRGRLVYAGLAAQFSRQRAAGFLAAVGRVGRVAELPERAGDLWWDGDGFCARLVRDLRPGDGVLAVNDTLAWGILRALHEAGRCVPDEVRVLGIDDLQLARSLGGVSLSSIPLPWDRLGEQVAETGLRLLRGEPVPPRRLLPPEEVVVRTSTGAGHPLVAGLAAVWAADPLVEVSAAVRRLGCARRTLERACRDAGLGAPAALRRRRLLDRAAAMLARPGSRVADVAAACGFRSGTAFARAWRQSFGGPPRCAKPAGARRPATVPPSA
jgi:AraC-like DNA-binding protein